MNPTTPDFQIDVQNSFSCSVVATSPDTDSMSYEWHEHEHTTPSVHSHAEQLLKEAGSPELAKHAIDVAANQMDSPLTIDSETIDSDGPDAVDVG